MVFIESQPFTRRLHQLAGESADEVLRGIQNDLIQNPAKGNVVQGLAACAKLGQLIQHAARESAAAIVICTCTLSIGIAFICSFYSTRMSRQISRRNSEKNFGEWLRS